MDSSYLKHKIDVTAESSRARLVLDGDLTETTVARLIEKLDAAGARPQLVDASSLRFADLAALAALLRWARRVGLTALCIVNAPRQLVDLTQRFNLSQVLPLDIRARRHSVHHVAA